jgi:antitoxin Phd
MTNERQLCVKRQENDTALLPATNSSTETPSAISLWRGARLSWFGSRDPLWCGDASEAVRRRRLYNTRAVLYALCMTTMTVSAARQNLPGAVDQAQTEPVVLERYGRAAAVLVSPEHYARLVAALEDAEDVEAFDAAMAEEGANIPWDQAKADLGWE